MGDVMPVLNLLAEPELLEEGGKHVCLSCRKHSAPHTAFPSTAFASDTLDASVATLKDAVDPLLAARLIVEVLVVRKMSLDESFLDFGGFTLI
jgi:hypothetical protein